MKILSDNKYKNLLKLKAQYYELSRELIRATEELLKDKELTEFYKDKLLAIVKEDMELNSK